MMAGSMLSRLSLWLTGTHQQQPTRVGVLNTGELILVAADGQAQVLSEATTARIRAQLLHTDFADSERVLFPPALGQAGGTA